MDAETERISLAGSVEEADIEKIGDAILEVTTDAWLSEPEITEAVEGATARKRRVLRELVKTGRLAREGTGKRGDPYAYSEYLFSCSTPYVGTREQETSELKTPRPLDFVVEPREQETLPFSESISPDDAQYH